MKKRVMDDKMKLETMIINMHTLVITTTQYIHCYIMNRIDSLSTYMFIHHTIIQINLQHFAWIYKFHNEIRSGFLL